MSQGSGRTHRAIRALLLVGLIGLVMCGVRALPGNTPEVTVAYEVTGSGGPVEIRYENADGALAAPTLVTLPWRRQFTVPAAGRFLSLSAGRTDSAPGDVTCRITVDGTLIALDGLSGGYIQCTGALSRR
ncbi:MmpS family transport accessory protein [Mycolicibacterium litorale]|uniref:MmpS family transport accessory protein n=1 Tax=Mycolicibacterium litorale TaxID=758802 RepID=UPI003CEF00E5